MIKKLYESFATDKLSEKRFEVLLAEYEQEQTELMSTISQNECSLEVFETDSERVKQFLALSKKHTDFSVLTNQMLKEYIEKIFIHAPDRSTGDRVQEVEIHLKFIGKFEIPMPEISPEELDDIEKQRKRREYHRQESHNKTSGFVIRKSPKKKAKSYVNTLKSSWVNRELFL